MPNIAYNISLKGYVGGLYFDRSKVDKVLAKNEASRLSRSARLSQERHCGEWDSEEDFARHIVEECNNLEKMMGSLANYFDY